MWGERLGFLVMANLPWLQKMLTVGELGAEYMGTLCTTSATFL